MSRFRRTFRAVLRMREGDRRKIAKLKRLGGGGDFYAEQLPSDENVVAVSELALGLEAEVGPVSAVHVRQHEPAAGVFQLAVRSTHVEVAREVQIAALAPDLKTRTACTNRHSTRTALENLGDAKRTQMFWRRIEVRTIRSWLIGGLRRRIKSEDLLPRKEVVIRVHIDGPFDPDINAVERAFVTNDEMAIAVKKVCMSRGDKRIVGKHELAAPPDEVLIGVQLVAETFDPFAANQDQLGFAGRLKLSEELGPRLKDFRRYGGAAATTELVAQRHSRRTRAAHEVFGLVHELLDGLPFG